MKNVNAIFDYGFIREEAARILTAKESEKGKPYFWLKKKSNMFALKTKVGHCTTVRTITSLGLPCESYRKDIPTNVTH